MKWRRRPVWMFQQTEAKKRSSACANWNTRFADKAVGYIGLNGYNEVVLFRRKYRTHRLIWKMVHGIDPYCIDHINRVRSDNSLANLRNVAMAENSLNQSPRSNNTSGTPGVFWHSGFNRWMARIKVRGKEYSLGRYTDKDAAIAARREGEVRFNAVPRSL